MTGRLSRLSQGGVVRRFHILIAILGAAALRVDAASLTLGGLVDSEEGVAWRASGVVSRDSWQMGAGLGAHRMEYDGASYSGTSLNLATRLQMGRFFAGISGQGWKDSGDLTSLGLLGEAGWMSQNGFTVAALIADRHLRAPYTTTSLQGAVLEHEARSDGQGVGAGLAWTGQGWTLGARFLAYDYRHRHESDAAPVVLVPGLLDELASIGGDLSSISAATPVLQILEQAGLLGTVQDTLAAAGAAVPAVLELTDDVLQGLPLPVPTVAELLDLGLFPRMQQLGGSPLTLVAGAPDRELVITAQRQFRKTSIRADWQMQRDALTRDDVHVGSMTFGYRFTATLGIDATIGMADGDVNGRIGYGGLSLTWRSAP
jgi:hypothetical protein